MIFQEYENKEIGPELLKTFNEDLDSQLLETLEAYSVHKDYNRLRIEVSHFASNLQSKLSHQFIPRMRIESESPKSFSTFEESVWYFIEHQMLS